MSTYINSSDKAANISLFDEWSLNSERISLKNMGRNNTGSNMLIIVGILGIVVAMVVAVMVWRAILRW